MDKFEERHSVEIECRGEKIFGIFHRPAVSRDVPAVLICHGYAGHKVGKNRLYVHLSESLAKLGIASFRFDFRGSGDSEGSFENMTIEGELADALIAADYLKNHKGIDTKRLGIFGRSFGGVVAILAAERKSIFKSIALWAPAFHAIPWKQAWLNSQDALKDVKMRSKLLQFDGNPVNEKFLLQFFELELEKHLTRLKDIPLLHIHGERDKVIDVSHSDYYSEHRQKALAETIMLRLPNTDHDFSHLEERTQAILDTSTWFKRTLE